MSASQWVRFGVRYVMAGIVRRIANPPELRWFMLGGGLCGLGLEVLHFFHHADGPLVSPLFAGACYGVCGMAIGGITMSEMEEGSTLRKKIAMGLATGLCVLAMFLPRHLYTLFA